MADTDKTVDLIGRYAANLRRKDKRSLAERAAEKLAEHGPPKRPPSPPAPAVATEGESVLSRAGRVEDSIAVPSPPPPTAPPAAPPASGNGEDAAGASVVKEPDPPKTSRGKAESPAAQVVPRNDQEGGGVLTAAGRRAAAKVAPTKAPSGLKPDDGGAKDGKAAAKDKGNYAEIDLVQLQLAGFVSPNSERTRISEEFRIIKRPLLLNAFARGPDQIANGHLIMVTSARPGEGKTFTSLNLAMSIASERELYVLLIDADVHRGTLMSELGVTAEKGLVDMLHEDDLTLNDTLVHTNIPNLTVLPCGTRQIEATELLASQRMDTLMKDIAGRYKDRVVIIDTPPVLASSEASVLALHVGQIVMVVEAGETTRQTMEQTLPMISACQHIKFLLNKTTFNAGSDRFGMYPAYGDYGG